MKEIHKTGFFASLGTIVLGVFYYVLVMIILGLRIDMSSSKVFVITIGIISIGLTFSFLFQITSLHFAFGKTFLGFHALIFASLFGVSLLLGRVLSIVFICQINLFSELKFLNVYHWPSLGLVFEYVAYGLFMPCALFFITFDLKKCNIAGVSLLRKFGILTALLCSFGIPGLCFLGAQPNNQVVHLEFEKINPLIGISTLGWGIGLLVFSVMQIRVFKTLLKSNHQRL